ncbi:MAG: GTPase Era [Clostridia bacterium]
MIKIFSEKYKKIIEKVVDTTLEKVGNNASDVDVEINITDEDTIKELNLSTRKIDKVTDVLSYQNIANITLPLKKEDYPYEINMEDNSIILGEIFVCEPRAIEQANEYGHSIAREIGFLTCHGMLHLLGYDHQNEEDSKKMMTLTEEIMAICDLKRDSNPIVIEDEKDVKSANFRSGFVAIMGKPNAGKSTLINTIVGEKVSIVSWKPQTTRNKIMGVYNTKDYQIVFIDTPGIHKPRNQLGEYMMKSASKATEGVDCIVYVVDCEKGFDEKDRANIVGFINGNYKVVVAVNKVDHVTREKVYEILSELNKFTKLVAVVPLSALKNKNVEPLVEEIKKLLTDTIKYFDDDQYTNSNMYFTVSEIIREKALRLLDKEVPYGIGVDVREYRLDEKKNMVFINADIICEKEAHKPIILGKGGSMIKKIGTYARQDLEEIIGKKVMITVYVRVKGDWRDNGNIMNDLGYNIKDLNK